MLAAVSWFFEVASVLVRLDHVAGIIVNANRCALRPTVELRIYDCVLDCVRLAIASRTNGSLSEIIAVAALRLNAYGTMKILLVHGSFTLLPDG